MAKVPNAIKNIAKNFNRLSTAHEHYRQTTDGRAIAYSVNLSSRSLKSTQKCRQSSTVTVRHYSNSNITDKTAQCIQPESTHSRSHRPL